jgi:hypothetical protein
MFSIEQPAPDHYPELLAARRQLFDYAVAALERYVQAGVLVGDARTLVHALWITLHGLMSLHVANQLIHGRSLRQLTQPLVAAALGTSGLVLRAPLSVASRLQKRPATKPTTRSRP